MPSTPLPAVPPSLSHTPSLSPRMPPTLGDRVAAPPSEVLHGASSFPYPAPSQLRLPRWGEEGAQERQSKRGGRFSVKRRSSFIFPLFLSPPFVPYLPFFVVRKNHALFLSFVAYLHGATRLICYMPSPIEVVSLYPTGANSVNPTEDGALGTRDRGDTRFAFGGAAETEELATATTRATQKAANGARARVMEERRRRSGSGRGADKRKKGRSRYCDCARCRQRRKEKLERRGRCDDDAGHTAAAHVHE